MHDLIPLYVAIGSLAGILANIALWAPRRIWVKIAALVTVTALLPVVYLSLSEMLSRPKPIEIEWANRELAEATVLGAQMDEGKAIYVWLGLEGYDEPRAYTLPWNEQMAKQLHGAERSAEQNGTRVKMRLPFEDSLDQRGTRFYSAPPPPPPEKQRPPQNPLRHQNSQSAADGRS